MDDFNPNTPLTGIDAADDAPPFNPNTPLQAPSPVEIKLNQAHKYYTDHADEYWGRGSASYLEERIPAVNIGASIGHYINLSGAIKGMKSGNPSDQDIDVLAQFKARQDYEAQKSGGGQALDVVTKVPALVAEFAAAGGVGTAAKEAATAGLGKYVAEGLATKAAGYGAKLATQTALTPSMYIDHAVNTNIEKDRDPLDPRGLPGAFGLALAQNAVLGEVGRQTGKVFTGSGLGQAAGRVAVQAASGPFAQAATDAVTGFAGLSTGYGSGKLVLDGKYGEALQHAAMDALTFASFGVAHEIVSGGKGHKETTAAALDKIKGTIDAQAKAGATPEEAATALKTEIEAQTAAVKGEAPPETGAAFKSAFGVDMPTPPPPGPVAPPASPREAATALEIELRQAQSDLLNAKRAERLEAGNKEMSIGHSHDRAVEMLREAQKRVKDLQKRTDEARVNAAKDEAAQQNAVKGPPSPSDAPTPEAQPNGAPTTPTPIPDAIRAEHARLVETRDKARESGDFEAEKETGKQITALLVANPGLKENSTYAKPRKVAVNPSDLGQQAPKQKLELLDAQLKEARHRLDVAKADEVQADASKKAEAKTARKGWADRVKTLQEKLDAAAKEAAPKLPDLTPEELAGRPWTKGPPLPPEAAEPAPEPVKEGFKLPELTPGELADRPWELKGPPLPPPEQKLEPKGYLAKMRQRQAERAAGLQPKSDVQPVRTARDFTTYQPPTDYEKFGVTKVEAFAYDALMSGEDATELGKKGIMGLNSRQAVHQAAERASKKLGNLDTETGKPKSATRIVAERSLEKSGLNSDGTVKDITENQAAVDNYIAEMAKKGTYLSPEEAKADMRGAADYLANKENAFNELWMEYLNEAKKRGVTFSGEQLDRLNDLYKAGQDPPPNGGRKYAAKQKKKEKSQARAAAKRSGPEPGVRNDPQPGDGNPPPADSGAAPGAARGQPAGPTKPVWNPDKLTKYEWLRMHQGKTHPVEVEALRIKNEGGVTLWDSIQRDFGKPEAWGKKAKKGSIAIGSIAKDFGPEMIGEILPKSYFSKDGSALDEIAEHYGMTEEEVLAKLLSNQIVEHNAYLDKVLNDDELNYHRKNFADEYLSQHPEATQDEADAEAERFIQSVTKSGADQGPPPEIKGQAGPDKPARGPSAGPADDQPFSGQFRGEPGRNKPITGPSLVDEPTPLGGAFRRGLDRFVADEAGSLDLDKVKEFALQTKQKFMDGVRAAHLAARNLGHEMFPATHDESPEVGNKMSTFATSRHQSARAKPYFIDKVLGENVTEHQSKLWWTTLKESRLRYAAAEALARGDLEGAKRASRTFVGVTGSALKDEATYLATLKDADFLKAVDNYKTDFVPIAEQFYKEAAGIDPADSIDSLTQIPGLPVPFKAIREGDKGGIGLGPSAGSLSAPKLRKLGATNEAKFSAEKYEDDFREMLGYIIDSRVETANKHEMIRTGVAKGQMEWARGGPERISHFSNAGDEMIMRKMPDVNPPKGSQENARGETSLYVNEKIFEEMKNALNMNEPGTSTRLVKSVADKINAANLFVSTGEFLYHGTNQATMFFTKPGMRYSDLFSNIRARYDGNPAFKAKMMEIARLGADKPSYGEKGNDSLLKLGSRMLDGLSDVMRATAHDAYQRLAKEAKAGNIQFDDSPQAERNFINQLGKYERRSQHGLVQWLRDSGIGPFATAGSNYVEQSVRALGLDPGIKGEGVYSKLYLRANFLKNITIAAGTIAAINFMRWGRVDGDDRTPFGNIKLWEDGRGSHSIDVTAPFLVKRGLRTTGLLSMIEGGRGATPTATNFDKGFDDVLHAFLHPTMGPAAQAALIAAKGYNTIGMQVAEKAQPGESQLPKNLKAAALNVNPIVAAGMGAARPNDQRTMLERFGDLAGPYGPRVRQRPVGNTRR